MVQRAGVEPQISRAVMTKWSMKLRRSGYPANWHKSQRNQISAPLIIDPTAENMTQGVKEVCRKFEAVTGMRVAVQERAGDSVKHVAKPEHLRRKSCGRAECFPCTTGGGECEKNGAGYKIVGFTCLRVGKCTEY